MVHQVTPHICTYYTFICICWYLIIKSAWCRQRETEGQREVFRFFWIASADCKTRAPILLSWICSGKLLWPQNSRDTINQWCKSRLVDGLLQHIRLHADWLHLSDNEERSYCSRMIKPSALLCHSPIINHSHIRAQMTVLLTTGTLSTSSCPCLSAGSRTHDAGQASFSFIGF